MKLEGVLRLVGRAAAQFSHLRASSGHEHRSGVDRGAAVAVEHAELQPVAQARRIIAQEQGRAVHGRDQEVKVAVVIKIADG